MRNLTRFAPVTGLRFVVPLMAAVALGGGVSACSMTTGDQSSEEYADSAGITAKVKTALANEGGIAMFNRVNVETSDQVVQLSGFVPTSADKARAGDIALGIDGVHSVRNDIVVQP